MRNTCALCGHKIDTLCGSSSVRDVSNEILYLCHPVISENHMDCYHLWTVYNKRPVDLINLEPRLEAPPVTYAELVASINETERLAHVVYTSAVFGAIKAAVRLHAPEMFEGRLCCPECMGTDYPCNTIREFMREMG